MKLILAFLLLGSSAWAWDSAKCSKMLNDGLFKKYEWGGVGDYNINAMTKETKKSGSTIANSNITTENSTAISDPKYSSNVSTSETQSTSSFGECSMFALQERREQRDAYIVQNFEQIKKEIAQAYGNHLDTLFWFSLCDDEAKEIFQQSLQKNFAKLFPTQSLPQHFAKDIDALLKASAPLSSACYRLSSL